MSASVVAPDDFVFGTQDETISLTYSTHGVVGPSLTYHNETDQAGVGTYTGDQLESAENILGQLVTVTLEWTPDDDRRTLTLLVPPVYLEQNQGEVGAEVETLAIWTTHREGRATRGQMHLYEEVRLSGTATRVVPA